MHSFLHFKDFIKSYFSGGVICALLMLMICGAVDADNKALTLSASSKFGTTSPANLTQNGVTWTATTNSGAIQTAYQSAYDGQQFGTSGTAWTGTFSTSSISGTITKIDIVANTGGSATLSTKVGTNAFLCNSKESVSVTKKTNSTGNTYTFEGTSTGDIVITVSSTSKAFYLKSITVTYTSSTPAFTLTKNSETINAGETYNLASIIKKADKYNGTITYATGDESIATVNENGVITGVGNGTTDITITAADGDFAKLTAKFSITVNKVDTRQDPAFAWSKTSYEPYFDTENKTFPTLSFAEGFDQTITYSSSEESVATINAAGKITVLTAGETTITASYEGNTEWKESSASYTLNIKKRVTDLSFGEQTSFSINLGETFTAPTATVAPKNGKEYDGTITYATSDANIADVNAETGAVEIKAAGTVTITATASATNAWTDGTANYTLTVVDPNAPKDLFYESFDKCNGTGGNDNQWSGISGTPNIIYDNNGWYAPKGYAAYQCGRFGTGSAAGNPTTPVIAFEAGKTYTLTLKCGSWADKTPQLNISIVDATATLSQSSISMTAGQWNEATITISDITGPAKINFTGDDRFFLDEIRVVEKKETEPEPDLTLTFTKSVYTTYVTPCDIEFPTDLSGYIVTEVNENNVITEEVLTAPKGTPVIVKAKDLGTYTLAKAEEVLDDVTANQLRASDGTIKGGNNIYAMAVKSQGVGFYRVKDTVTIPAGKAYLKWENAPISNAKEFIPIGGETTGITNIAGEENNGKKIYYNLNGMRVDNPQKGVYIVNGKKVIF